MLTLAFIENPLCGSPSISLARKTLQQPSPHKAAKDAAAQGDFLLGHGLGVDVACRVEVNTWRSTFVTGCQSGNQVPGLFPKFAIQ
jgi:hypothetical protein